MTTTLAPPPGDLWRDALRIAVPDVDDFDARHCRGVVRLPHDVSDARAGQLVDAWVCCDPGCGGVELTEAVLQLNHGCCGVASYRGVPVCLGDEPEQRGRHRVGLGTLHYRGWHHGPFTAYWEPEARKGETVSRPWHVRESGLDGGTR